METDKKANDANNKTESLMKRIKDCPQKIKESDLGKENRFFDFKSVEIVYLIFRVYEIIFQFTI